MTDQAPPSSRFAFYALPAIPLAAIALPFYIVVPTFYADHFALSLATIGTLLLGTTPCSAGSPTESARASVAVASFSSSRRR
jgi:hypothetical protein